MALNKKVGIIGFCSVLLVAMVVGVVYTHVSSRDVDAEDDKKNQINESRKAVKSICKPTQYRETCEKNLMPVAKNDTDPKDLIKAGFDFAMQNIRDNVKKSKVLQDAEKDPNTASAYKVCKNVLRRALRDLQRSFEMMNDFDFEDLDDRLFDLKVWLSSASKGQNTCTDAFDKTSGDVAEKMKELLKLSKELTINGFNMIDELTRVLTDMQIQGKNTRKLLQVPLPPDHQPAWVKPDWKDILVGDAAKEKAHAVVAADGSGKFKTVNEAVKSVPSNNPDVYIIYIKAGVYAENVLIGPNQPNVVMVGDGPTKTKITGSRSDKKGYNTLQSSTVGVEGFNFLAKDIGFENTAHADEGPAVALRIAADKSVVVNCRMDGFQDTLFAQVYRQFYKDCVVSGTIDFVFGGGIAIFQGCTVIGRKPASGQSNMLVAQNREFPNDISGIILDHCALGPAPDLAADPAIQSFLGRPWKPYSRMIIMNSQIEGFINATGWDIWLPDKPNTKDSFIVEFNNKGPGADVSKRVTWPSFKKISPGEVSTFAAPTFLKGDSWIPATGVPCTATAAPSFSAAGLASGSAD
ncbi:Pectinesterase [Heracleum sosnowskyi]|uniref:Pectinesterase n=1 Tax=Heracleum sosnowskyi TaxID=360622 RepID=A0AAD8HTE3_9APIA|nr:Pectinesterase [Heracleum sosnowskyi]